jgi:hypothetical protein
MKTNLLVALCLTWTGFAPLSAMATITPFAASPNPVTPGKTINFTANIDAGVTAKGAKVTLWFYNSAGAYLGSASETGVNFTAGTPTPVSISYATAANLALGTYTYNLSFYDSTGKGIAGAPNQTNDGNFTVSNTVIPPGGSASPATTLSVPTTISNLGLQKDPYVIAGYLDVTHYGAKGDGKTDDTAAFQSALNDASFDSAKHPGTTMVVYVPSGTYLISNTLTGYQFFNDNNVNIVNTKYGAGNGLLSPSLVGPGSGTRPTIVLKDGTFTNAASPQPVIHFVNSPTDTVCGATNPTIGCFDILFNAVVRDINITTGNNPGAIGLQFYSAQMSYIQNVSIDATGGYAGIQGVPATEVATNVAVKGGQYGIIITGRAAGVESFAGLSLTNQSVAGLYMFTTGAVSLAGFNIQETNPGATGILANNSTNQGTAVTLLDGTISVSSTTQPAISNVGGDTLYLNNTYLQAPSGNNLIVNKSSPIAANGQLQLINEYTHTDQSTNSSATGGYALSAYAVINDVEQKTDYGPFYGNGAPPANLLSRHVPADMPWAFDQNVAWVTDYGADPTATNDSTAAIRNAINAAHSAGSDEVFLPRGKYLLSGTVVLYPNTRFFGLPGNYSELHASPNWVTNLQIHPFIQVGDAVNNPSGTAAGSAILSDVMFFLPTTGTASSSPTDQTYLTAIDWQTGAGSVLNQISVEFQYNNITVSSPASRNVIQVDASGGGRWYGLQEGGDNGFNGPSGHMLYFNGSKAPLTLYGSNPEHTEGGVFYGFTNAANIRVLGMKTESHGNPLFDVESSNNIFITGINGDGVAPSTISNSTNVTLSCFAYYEPKASAGYGGEPFISDDTASYPFTNAYSLFKLGSFNNGAF